MKNKGYTLIELLAVFVILGVIVMISVPIVSSVLNSSKSKSYDEQVKILENAARTYMSENSTLLPDENDSYNVTIDELKNSGLLKDEDIKNPIYSSGSTEENKKNQYFEGCIIVTNTSNKFTYTYQDECN